MARAEGEWQQTADTVMRYFRENAGKILKIVSPEAVPTVRRLLEFDRIEVSSDLGDAGFVLDRSSDRLKLSVGGLNLIYAAGEEREFSKLAEEAFCEVALSLYLFHEAHHVTQGLIEHEDVQRLKRTAGYDKLGEIDLIADAVAAQIFAALHAADSDRHTYAAAFFNALSFAIGFCFPAFGFPIESKHKVQRALGVVLMALSAERAIRKDTIALPFDAPIFPYFSDDYAEVAILTYAGNVAIAVMQFSDKLHPESVKEMLETIDNGDVAQILQKARALA